VASSRIGKRVSADLTPERWAQVEVLFHRAAECGPEHRTALLDEACSNDPELRREVEALLSSDRSAGGYVQGAVRSEFDTIGFPLVGETISHYRILEGLGGGGMGLVYRAEDIKLGRQVALKFLPEESVKDPLALGRFEREARSASALEHPNICPIYEFGEHEGQPFLVMQLLEGQTLRELIAATGRGKPPLGLNKLLDLALEIADGLHAAHHRGIIHRDIKPANIFVTSQGQAKILDFGLAKLAPLGKVIGDPLGDEPRDDGQADRPLHESVPLATPDPFVSRTGTAIGTAGYMSPEQVRGETLDTRTDLFSFGLVLHEMATGQRAFEDNTGPALHNAILTQTPVPVRQLNPQIPAKLGAIINKALQKDREARYQTVSEMRDELEALGHEIAPPDLRQRWILASAAVVVLLVASSSVWFIKRQPSSAQAPREIKFRQLTINSSENPVTSGAISPNGKYLAYVDAQGIHVKDTETGTTQAVSSPQHVKKDSVDWDIVGAAWFPDSMSFMADAHPVSEGPDAWSSRTTSIWLFSRLGGVPRKLRDHANGWSVSSDGSSIAFGTNIGKLGNNRELWLMGPDGGQPRKLFEANENGAIEFMLWSPDGQRGLSLSSNSSDGTVVSLDVHGGSPIAAFKFDEFLKQARGDLSWLPDGRLIYQVADTPSESTHFNSALDTCNFWTMRLDVHTGKPREKPKRLTNWTGFCVGTANPTADGKRLAFVRGGTQHTVYVADLVAGGTRILNARHFTLDESLNFPQSWTNDGKKFVFTSNRDGQFGIYKQSLDQDTPELISMGGFRDAPVSPDGKWVFAIPLLKSGKPKDPDQLMRIPLAGGAPELVTTTSGTPEDSTIFCARPPSNLCVLGEATQDRKHLIFASIDSLKGRGPELARFDFDPSADFWFFDLSPDGTRLAVSVDHRGPIHILSLRGQPEQVVRAKFNNAGEFHWAADGKGLYVPDHVKSRSVLSYLGLNGNMHVLWKSPGEGYIYGIPSPDGRHLAIAVSSTSNNVWMMENF
jgi:serine/threonine protein kinase/Tol biopolymer transport system component